MKLVAGAFLFIIFHFSAASVDFDLTEEGGIDNFLAQFFEEGDPSKYELIVKEVKKHSDELLDGFLSYVGRDFNFDISDLNAQIKKFKQDLDVEKVKEIVEDIFGIESEVALHLQKNSATLKDKIISFIDSVLSDFGFARKKRAIDDTDILISEDDSEINKGRNNRRNQQNEPNKKGQQKNKLIGAISKGDVAGLGISDVNIHKETEEISDVNILRETEGEIYDVIPIQNDGSEMDLIDTDSVILKDDNEQYPLDIVTQKGQFDKDPNSQIHKEEEDDPYRFAFSSKKNRLDDGLLDSLITDRFAFSGQKNRLDDGLLDSEILDIKIQEDDDKVYGHASSSQKGQFDNGLLDSGIFNRNNQVEAENEQYKTDFSMQNDRPNKGLPGSLIPDIKIHENDDEQYRYAFPSQESRSDKSLLDFLNSNDKANNVDIETGKGDWKEEEFYKPVRNSKYRGKLGLLGDFVIKKLVDLKRIKKKELAATTGKALGLIEGNIPESKDRALDLLSIYGDYLYDIFNRKVEKFRSLYQILRFVPDLYH